MCHEDAGVCVGCLTSNDCEYPQFETCTDGRCTIDCEDDVYEPNDRESTAAAVPFTDGVFRAPDLTPCGVEAEDWFALTREEAGPLVINVAFANAEGDIDVQLRAPGAWGSEDYLEISQSLDDNEDIFVESLPAGDYLVWVYGYEQSPREPSRPAPPRTTG